MRRRSFLGAMSAAAVARGAGVPIRQLTRGPRHHWFGYYDKLEFDPAGRYVLGNEVDFEGRSPRPEDRIRVGMVDLQNKDRWIDLGGTAAWNWQQGCMLQWVPGSAEEVIWNDRVDGEFVARIKNVRTGKERVLPSAIYTLAPSGKWGLTCDFRRLNHSRPGYGYAGIADPNFDTATPGDTGIWKVDLATGKRTLLLTIEQIAKIPYPAGYSEGARHWVNHLLISPDEKRFIFLHRWRGKAEGTSFSTRMFTASAEGKDLYVLDPYGKTSHFVWRDPRQVIAWAWHPSKGNRFYLYQDRSERVEVLGEGVMTVNGHCTYLPIAQQRWILNDTYPDQDRLQNVYLFDTASGRRHPLASLLSPKEYTGEWRCDTHPRYSPDGTKVVVDSPHNGGRQMYLLDIASVVRA